MHYAHRKVLAEESGKLEILTTKLRWCLISSITFSCVQYLNCKVRLFRGTCRYEFFQVTFKSEATRIYCRKIRLYRLTAVPCMRPHGAPNVNDWSSAGWAIRIYLTIFCHTFSPLLSAQLKTYEVMTLHLSPPTLEKLVSPHLAPI